MTQKQKCCSALLGTLLLAGAFAGYWHLRGNTNSLPSPPDPEMLEQLMVMTAHRPPLHDYASEPRQDHRSTQKGNQSQQRPTRQQAQEFIPGLSDMPEDNPTQLTELSLEHFRDAIKNKDSQTIAAYRERLLAYGEKSLPFIEQLLRIQHPNAERFCIELLARINSPAAITIAFGHMLTNPGFGSAHWNRLATILGRSLDGTAVDLVAHLVADAPAESRSRILALLAHVHTEEALFRLLLVAAEMDDIELDHVTMKAIFEDGKRASVEILKDIMITHKDAEVVELAAIGIARRGTTPETRFLAETANSHSQHAETAVFALTHVTSGYSQNTLIDIANDNAYNLAVRQAAILALGQGGQSHNVERALHNLIITSDDPNITSIAQEQRNQTPSPAASPAIANVETWF